MLVKYYFNDFQAINKIPRWPNMPHSSHIFMITVLHHFQYFNDSLRSWRPRSAMHKASPLQSGIKLEILDELVEKVEQNPYCKSRDIAWL